MLIAQIIVYTATAYMAAGLIFGIWFIVSGVGRIDAGARGAGVFFRFLILFGTIIFWPMLAFRLIRGNRKEANA